MSLHYADGDVLVFPAPVGGATLDVPAIVGNMFVIPRATASVGDVIAWEYKGIKELPQAAGQTFNTIGQPVYWNASNGDCESATSATNYLIGSLQAIPASGTADLLVLLHGSPVFVGGVPGDIQGVTAGTGLAGGGTSGTVTVSLSTATQGVLPSTDEKAALVGTSGTAPDASNPFVDDADSRLTDARTPTAHAASHATAGADAIAPADIGAVEEAKLDKVDVTIALGAASGSSAADPTCIGANVLGVYPKSGNDQVMASEPVVGVDGSITVTLAAVSTTEAVWTIVVLKA